MKTTPKLDFDVEKLDNGFLVNIHYQPIDYSKGEYLRFFFTTIDEVRQCYTEWSAKLVDQNG